jgi:DNA-binding SARP family transcriptional activator
MEFRLLGPFEVWDNNQLVEIAGAKRRALLALLVLRANEVVRSELLVDELWGERPPRNAGAALHNHVSRLRKALGADTIASREWGYVLRAAPGDIDLRKFERLVADAEPLAARGRAKKLAEALAFWRGPPLADLVNEPALQRDIARLEELRLSTLERRIDADLEAGKSAGVVGELEALVAEQPLREHLRWLLILALYRAGRQAEALEVYRETRRVLTEELGLEPSPALKELEQAILRHDPSLDPNAPNTHAEPPAEEPQPKRRRVPPVALLALIALALAGTATAIALSRPEKGTSSGTLTEAIYETQPTTITEPATQTHLATHQQKATVRNHSTTSATHATSTNGTRSTKQPSLSRPATTTSATHSSARHRTGKQVGPPPSKLVTVKDTFSGSSMNRHIWILAPSLGTGVDLAQTNGQLGLTMQADATPNPQWNAMSTGYETACNLGGDFDARIDYKLLNWPAANGTVVGMNVAFPRGSNVINLVRASWASGQEVYTFATPSGSYRTLDTTDMTGGLRITRVGTLITSYIRTGGRWASFYSAHHGGWVTLQFVLWASGSTFAHKDVSIAFDNFVLKTPSGLVAAAACR